MKNIHQHNFLSINLNNKENEKVLIFGGSCISPNKEALNQAKYFVALETIGLAEREKGVPINYIFPIEDGKSPENIEYFHKMIDYLCTLLNKKINLHIGCLGSHGRTGLVISAIVQKMCQPLLNKLNLSAIDYVRNIYCIYAVENQEQEDFLINNCNVKKSQMSEV